MTTNDFGREALELCDEYANHEHYEGNLNGFEQLEKLAALIKAMQTQHQKELSAAQGEWIRVEDELPEIDEPVPVSCDLTDDWDSDYMDSCADTGDEWFANDPDRTITHWFRLPPPPIQEPQIEVPDLEVTVSDWDGPDTVADNFQDAHKAAMLPVLQENAELKRKLKEAGL